MIATSRQPRPRFTNFDTLAAAIVAGSASSHRSWPLYCPGVAGGDDVEVGRWELRGGIAVPVGPVRLNHLVFRSTVVAAVADTTHCTATAGHGFVTGDTLRFWDTSVGAELADRVVTVAGNALSWAVAIVGMVAGDQAFAVLDSPLTVGDLTRNVKLFSSSLLSAAGAGLTITSVGASVGAVQLQTHSAPVIPTYWHTETLWTVTTAGVEGAQLGAMAGISRGAAAFSGALSGVRHTGAAWRTNICYGALAAPTFVADAVAVVLAACTGTRGSTGAHGADGSVSFYGSGLPGNPSGFLYPGGARTIGAQLGLATASCWCLRVMGIAGATITATATSATLDILA